jgi:hypothetical protein
MIRRMNSSNRGTVNAVSPWLGLQIIPLRVMMGASYSDLHPAIEPEQSDHFGGGHDTPIDRRGVDGSRLAWKHG